MLSRKDVGRALGSVEDSAVLQVDPQTLKTELYPKPKTLPETETELYPKPELYPNPKPKTRTLNPGRSLGCRVDKHHHEYGAQ